MILDDKKAAACLAVVAFFVGFDRLFKAAAARGADFEIWGEFLKFSYAGNPRSAFSLPFTGNWLAVAAGLIILFLTVALVSSVKKHALIRACFLLSIISGAASNLYDRLRYGAVIDYLDLKYFTVFNLADVMIVAGVVGMLYLLVKEETWA